MVCGDCGGRDGRHAFTCRVGHTQWQGEITGKVSCLV